MPSTATATLTPAAEAWAAGRLLNTFAVEVEDTYRGHLLVTHFDHAWGIPADAYAYAAARGLDAIRMVDVRTSETFLLAVLPAGA